MLTVVGYSINDTVVVFDRIKEIVGTSKRDMNSKDFLDNVNIAINTTLSRTIMTSSTTLMVVLCLFLFGGQVLSGFSYSLLVGILIGTYSSVFIASPIFVDISLIMLRYQKKKKIDAKG
jgi:preprotein translocase SecF subunit